MGDTGRRFSGAFPWLQILVFSVLLFLSSAAIPITEAAIPERYPEGWLDQALADPQLRVHLQQAGIPGSLPDFASQNGLKVLYGRALFPRYYGPKQGIPGEAWFAFVPRDYARLGFYLVGPASQNVVLPLDRAPAAFPHAADVIVLGCQRDEYLEARLVILKGEMDIILQRTPLPDWDCDRGE